MSAIPEDSSTIELGIVVVSYNSSFHIPTCVSMLRTTPEVAVVVVDNASNDGSALVARESGATVVEMGRNAGYASACNAGIKAMPPKVPWIGFVNPDALIEGRDLVRMVREAPPRVAAISPLMLDDEGRPQADIVRPRPSARGTIQRYLLSQRGERKARREYSDLSRSSSRHFTTEVSSGGSLMVRADDLKEIGGFAEVYFLNGEDVELCWQLRKRGRLIVIDRETTGRHNKGTSSAGVSSVGRMLECGRAEVMFFERHRSGFVTAAVALAVLAGCALRTVIAARSFSELRLFLRLNVRFAGELARSVTRSIRKRPATSRGEPLFI